MSVTFSAHNRDLTLFLSGEIDHHGIRGLVRELDLELDAVLPKDLTVDCAGVTFMDSSGIAVLLRLWKRNFCQKMNWKPSVTVPSLMTEKCR